MFPLVWVKSRDVEQPSHVIEDGAIALYDHRPANDMEMTMILEVADLRVDPDRAFAFEAAIAEGLVTVITEAKGYRGHKVNRSQETSGRYLLMIEWETLENHTVDFRGSDAFAKWRGFVGPFFVATPVVEHFELVTASN